MFFAIFQSMITEEQKYISVIWRNLGFTFLSPFGAIIFQYLVFEKTFKWINVLLCLSISAISWLLFYIGYNSVKEKKNVRA